MVNTSSAVNILQWNCRSLLRRLPELHYLLEEHKINIAALCETRLNLNRHPTFTNHKLISKDRDRQGGGVAFLVDKAFRISIIRDKHIEQVCIRNKIEFLMGKIWISLDKYFLVCSVYSPPRSNNHRSTEPRAWHEILQYCSSFDTAIICRDVNGKSPLWSSH